MGGVKDSPPGHEPPSGLDPGPASPGLRPPATRLAAALLVLTLGTGAFVTWQAAFSTFASYDDEGYILISLRNFMRGGQLYDDIYSQYGPAFHMLEAGWHEVTGWPLDHRGIRIKTVVTLTLLSAAAAFVTWRIGRHALAGVVAAAVVILHLEKLVLEPAHPQELCLLLVAGILILATGLGARARPGVWAGIGLLVALLGLVKPNVGLLAALALALAAALELPATRGGTLVRWSVVAVTILAPVLLVGRLMTRLPGLGLVAVTSGGLVACVVVALRVAPPVEASWQPLGTLGTSSLATTLLVAGVAVAWWTSPSGLVYGLVGQHLRFAERFFELPQLSGVTVVVAAAGLGLAWRWGRSRRAGSSGTTLGVAKLVTGAVLVALPLVASLVSASKPLVSGLQDPTLAGLLASLGGAVSWVLLVPGPAGWTVAQWRPRLALALLAITQPLVAFPIAGSQLAAGTVWVSLVGIVSVVDGADLLGRSWRVWFPACLVALAVVAVTWHGVRRWEARQELEPLGLPGTGGLRLPPGQVALLRWAVTELPRHGDVFLAFPQARNSLYLWTNLEPPTQLNATYWPIMLSPAEQLRVAAALEARGRVAVLWDAEADRTGASFDGPDFPLVGYLRREFVTVEALGPLEVRVREGAARPALARSGEETHGD